jgi:hypothetical protein
MSHWDWVVAFQRDAIQKGDEQRMKLCQLHGDAYEFRETNPDRSLALYQEGAQLAKLLGEPWWELFYGDWIVTGMLFFKRDFRTVLDVAVKNTLELRKPLFDNFPQRYSIQRNLIASYVGIDPVGYADDIQKALADLEAEIPEGYEDRYLVLGSRREFCIEMGWLDKAEETSMHALRLCDADKSRSTGEHHSIFNYSGLCEVAGRRGDWKALAQYTVEGERVARRCELFMELCEFLVWQAVVARQSGDDEKGRYLFRRASSRVSRLKMPPDRNYFDAVAVYHNLVGELEEELELRQKELKSILGMGRLAYEARLRIQIAALLHRLGQPTDEALTAAREAVKLLRAPERYLEEIACVERGEEPATF